MNKTSRFETRPLYLQVRDMLLGRITTGNWKPGTLIPNEIELAREFGLSVGTVRKALDQMQAEHILTRRQGRGTFVNDLSTSEHSGRFCRLFGEDGIRLDLNCKNISISGIAADQSAKNVLELEEGSSVIHLVRLRSSGQKPILLEKSILPAHLFPGLPDDNDVPIEISALAQKYGKIAGSAEEMISISFADDEAADLLDVKKGHPLLSLSRKVFAVEGTPLEWRVALCNLSNGSYYKSVVA